MEFLMQHLTAIILAIIAILAGIVIRVRIKRSSNKVKQKGNKVGGDQAGRDIRKS